MKNMKVLGVLTTLLLVTVTAVHAESAVTTLNGDFAKLGKFFADDDHQAAVQLHPSADSNALLDEQLRISGRIRQLGRFTALFDTRKIFDFVGAGADKVYLQGEAFFQNDESALVTARLHLLKNGKYRVHLEFLDEGIGRYTLKRAFRIVQLSFTTDRDGTVSATRLKRGKKRAQRPGESCGAPLPSVLSVQHFNEGPVVASTLKQVTMRIEGDNELQNKGKTLSSYLATMMNMVDTWYKRDLGVTLKSTIIGQAQNYNANTEYNESDYTYGLHNEMRQKQPASSRSEYIHYLVTGKQAVGNSDGLAGVVPDLGTICKNKGNSIGFTIHYSDENFNYETTAHEVGHLFAAEHDDASTGGKGFLMNSGTKQVSSYISEFSGTSKSQVANHLQSHSNCLSTVDGGGDSGGGDSGGGDSGGGGDNSGDDSDDEYDDDYDDEYEDEEDSYTLKFKNKKRRKKLITKVRDTNGRKVKTRPTVRVSCGYDGSSYPEVIKTKTANRRGVMRFKYVKSETPPYCKAQVISNGSVVASSKRLSNVGTKEDPNEEEYDDDYYDDDYYDDDYYDDF